jgi:hypothetical protein
MNPNTKQLVPLKNKLYSIIKFNNIATHIVNDLQVIPNLLQLKLDNELIERVCNLIEFYVSKKMNLDKKELALSVFKKIDPNITEDELNHIGNTIEYFVSNNTIKKNTKTYKSCISLGNYFLKKV